MQLFFSLKKINAERYSALLISLATIATAWCAFQAAVWSGIQTFKLAEANAVSRSAIFAHIEANQERLLDAQLLLSLMDAYYAGNEQLAQIFFSQLSEDQHDSIESFLNNLFSRNGFSILLFSDSLTERDEQTYRQFIQSSERKHAEAAQANHTSDLYIFITVLFASSLFFSGMATKFEYESVQRYFLLAGTVLIFIAFLLILRLPVRF